MPKSKIESVDIEKIIKLRQTGHSLPEIRKITGRGGSTIFKYIKDVQVLPEYAEILRVKQGGSIERSKRKWLEASQEANRLMGNFSKRDKLFILSCLYWGEGSKQYDLSLNNSDPGLIKVFVECLQIIGVKKSDLRITLRIYEDINKSKAITFWANLLNLPEDKILGVSLLPGKKKGKLQYGMCRVRVAKGAVYFKLIMSMIDLIKSNFSRRSSMDRTSHS